MKDGQTPDERGTPEYSAGTGEYPSDEPAGTRPRESAEEAREALRREPPWWERMGFASLADALAYEKAIDDRVMGREPRDLRGLSLEEVLFNEPNRPSRRRKVDRPRNRQVNVKLTDDEISRLQQAARSYGVATATLARIFVVRATRIALKESPG